jgi:hypothetical protein
VAPFAIRGSECYAVRRSSRHPQIRDQSAEREKPVLAGVVRDLGQLDALHDQQGPASGDDYGRVARTGRMTAEGRAGSW